ncbi:thiopurine S-methyltransferase [Salinisphaera hydrothermalis]|uniref:Thiopurine S-methyltransferase n=1 Tax=Salinisphaera hydrothermalis (strain C41B8) TaxID=1304275 RepID=A0A084IJI0_SALHC|nr:thiopurine S-methyltransferase [Salinisphaera hydrothermalis]KEZ76864.1 thiopurine S-methyltransferase [Salinisphaera hydrothermalis C41B8]
MKQDFWLERWDKKQIGFHQPEGHPLLREHWSQLSLVPNSRILVPLCGKSRDMLWLAEQGHRVTGVELSAIAAREFFEEAELTYRRQRVGAFDCFVGDQVEIRVGDFFDLPAADLARFEGFYDRAALIALPEDMRRAYVDHLMSGLRRGATGLLITFGYDPAIMDGPPFNVDDEDVGELYGRYAHVDLLAERRGLPDSDHLRERGLTDARDGIYRIVRR